MPLEKNLIVKSYFNKIKTSVQSVEFEAIPHMNNYTNKQFHIQIVKNTMF